MGRALGNLFFPPFFSFFVDEGVFYPGKHLVFSAFASESTYGIISPLGGFDVSVTRSGKDHGSPRRRTGFVFVITSISP